MSFPLTPEDLHRYFEDLSVYQPDRLHWRRGAETTRLWIQLMNSGDTMEMDHLKRLLRTLSHPDGMSSGWHDLSMRILHWVTTLPPSFQAEAMAAYFDGVGEVKPESREWRNGCRITTAWRELVQYDSVLLPALEAFVTDAQQNWIFCTLPAGYRLASMIDAWLEGIQPSIALRVIPPD